jgi:t-SNARE complex subunit (syntaxin)
MYPEYNERNVLDKYKYTYFTILISYSSLTHLLLISYSSLTHHLLITYSSLTLPLSQQLKPIIDATNNRAKRTKTLLGLLQQETAKLKEEGILNASDLRVRQNLNTTITRKFVDEMKVYQSAQQDYKNAIKSKASRQIRSIQPTATDEQVEQVMRSEGGREALMKQAVLSNTVNDQIQTTFDKVAGKYQDVLTLEQSVAELHQMFLDFALLTEQQGELLDQIEYQVKEANDHVECANEETVKAIEYQSAIRKKQWYVGVECVVYCVLNVECVVYCIVC